MTVREFEALPRAIAQQLLAWIRVDALRVRTSPLSLNKAAYNQYLASPQFWNIFDRRWLLLFEADSALCAWPTQSLEYFLSMEKILLSWVHLGQGAQSMDGEEWTWAIRGSAYGGVASSPHQAAPRKMRQ